MEVVIATMFLLPVAFAIERKTAPQLSYKVSLKLFVHALYGMSASINITFVGLSYASETSASALLNLLPVLTFFLALLLRMESLKLKRFHGIVKVSGIVLCAAGVTILALYQGPKLKSFIHHPVFHHASQVDTHPARRWILGILLQSFATAMFALWTVFQGNLAEYPSMLLNAAVQVVFATVQSFVMALVMERDFSRWKLSLDVGLVAVIYCGVVVSAFSNYLQLWLIDKRGPVFVAVTAPLTFVITIILSLLIGEAVTLGSVMSGALMVGGLYNVLWGKRMEQVALGKQQGRSAGNAARFDFEEQERGAPVPATQDLIKPLPGAR
ncbi:WAT1-related protein At5g64700-like isoform X2 [Lolium rigidum]|uniref:WAT1-related protein At5g64700-like isoform X2 n=1 Tax=Lolium rigidum TaxID=89674 RepID=UPI001F5D66D2|nr:WAT1-related protein At5g64700-like isoform X2 [Lolium rigidum]XP_047054726.1 WAT1-related protein At5g64700-like isoform X2 [Lolium rigidum]